MKQVDFIQLRNSISNGTTSERRISEMKLFVELKKHCSTAIRNKSIRLNDDSMEDVIAMTITKVFQYLEKFEEDRPYLCLVNTILNNTLKDVYKAECSRGLGSKFSIDANYEKDEEHYHNMQIEDNGSFDYFEVEDHKYLKLLLKQEVEKLNPENRKIMTMHFADYTTQDIMDYTEKQRSNINTIIFRCRAIIKANIRKRLR